jgi:superfamily II DNA or RNA helicase
MRMNSSCKPCPGQNTVSNIGAIDREECMILPDALEPFRAAAQKKLSEGEAEEIIFSGRTYQVHTRGEKEPVWVFLQLDHDDSVKDLFCNCERCAETGVCVHMALALLAVFKGHTNPLHKRFEASPFFHIFRALSDASFSLQCKQQSSSLSWGDGNHSVLLKGPIEWMDKIQTMAHHREEETEETSIKFSDLSEEELAAWRQGTISDHLRFELSAHSELAKHLFLLSERKACHFRFEEGIPHRLFCDWKDIACTFPILENLPDILDSLNPDCTSPRIEQYGGRSIKDAKFDEEENACKVVFEGQQIDLSDAIQIGSSRWWYLPGSGFVRKWNKRTYLIHDPKEIAIVLDTLNLSQEVLSPSYQIDVQEGNGLTITPYLSEVSDLQEAHFFGHWMFRDDLGFRRIFPLRFQQIPWEVSLDDLPEFLSSNRNWLSSIPGFAVHERPPREIIFYQVDRSGALTFHQEHAVETEEAFKDLFELVFVEGEGFFLKEGQSRVPMDSPILPHHVAEFIRKESEWLKDIPGFFASHTPITGVGLEIKLVKKRIDLIPTYSWENSEFHKTAVFYDDMGYVPNVGFFHLPTLLAQHNFTRSYFAKDREQWDRFFLEQLPELEKEFPCTLDPRLERPKNLQLVCQGIEPHEIASALHSPSLWDASFYWESEKGRAAPHELITAYSHGDRFLPTAAGLLDLTDDRFGWLSSVSAPKAGKQYRLKTYDFLKIRAHDDFSFSSDVIPTTASVIQRLLNAVPEVPPDFSTLRSSLRPYQIHGVQWLWYLYLCGLSGLLCDDMGVGKTHQAMGLLSSVHAVGIANGQKPRFLIICPTSLLWHWKDKINAALPHLRVFIYFGGMRVLEDFTSDYDVFLTTYGIWRNESKVLHDIPFEVAIFDELQIAKNHVSQIWNALSQVHAAMRLGLTGTPVENQLRELKAVFDLVLPGYLPEEEVFREHYMRPIEREGANDRRDLLSRYVRPFLLRRRKQDVLPELPPKTEDLYFAELVGEQKELYRQVAARQATPLIQQLHDDQSPIPYMHIFALLSALKQVCNHPATYLRDIENFTRYDSGKWEAFVELFEEAQESGQKVVVFSQFLSMLDIMGLYFRSRNIGYAEIRGSTKNRGDQIARFQNDPSCQVFLGSLQAAGLGIDLTAGSVVIHYDRWWNAARENQATDRVHRIGQTRGVMVYKLMTVKTIEERIDQMIARKAQLFEDVIAYDDHQVVKKLDRAELLELLEGLDSV